MTLTLTASMSATLVNLCTKFEVSSFTLLKDRNGDPKFTK